MPIATSTAWERSRLPRGPSRSARRRGPPRDRRGARVTSVTFANAAIASNADRRCHRTLLEEWVGRETASFRLPPSRRDPGDVVQLEHDGRLAALRLTSVADAAARAIEAVRTDAIAYGLPQPRPRSARLAAWSTARRRWRSSTCRSCGVRAGASAARGRACVPWPGRVAVWRSPGEAGFELVPTLGRPTRMGTLAADLYPGARVAASRLLKCGSARKSRPLPAVVQRSCVQLLLQIGHGCWTRTGIISPLARFVTTGV